MKSSPSPKKSENKKKKASSTTQPPTGLTLEQVAKVVCGRIQFLVTEAEKSGEDPNALVEKDTVLKKLEAIFVGLTSLKPVEEVTAGVGAITVVDPKGIASMQVTKTPHPRRKP